MNWRRPDISQFQERAVALDKLQTRFTAWMGTLPIEELVERSTIGSGARIPVASAARGGTASHE